MSVLSCGSCRPFANSSVQVYSPLPDRRRGCWDLKRPWLIEVSISQVVDEHSRRLELWRGNSACWTKCMFVGQTRCRFCLSGAVGAVQARRHWWQRWAVGHRDADGLEVLLPWTRSKVAAATWTAFVEAPVAMMRQLNIAAKNREPWKWILVKYKLTFRDFYYVFGCTDILQCFDAIS